MNLDSGPKKGRVIAKKANFFQVDLELDGFNDLKKNRLLCTIRRRLNHIGCIANVGDKVHVEEIDWNEYKGVVNYIEPRENLLSRPPVANVSDVFVVVSVDQPQLDVDQVSRFLLTAEQIGVSINLILSKVDLISLNQLRNYEKQFKSWGYRPTSISLKGGFGLEDLKNNIKSRHLSVLCGPSGVGKTSLINFLMPNQYLPVSPVTKKLKRGRHTTRNVELFSISNNSLIADTPGFNRPEINIKPEKLASLFPELKTQLINQTCKFRNCLHRNEPGCLINKSWDRYSFYSSLLEDLINYHRQNQGGSASSHL